MWRKLSYSDLMTREELVSALTVARNKGNTIAYLIEAKDVMLRGFVDRENVLFARETASVLLRAYPDDLNKTTASYLAEAVTSARSRVDEGRVWPAEAKAIAQRLEAIFDFKVAHKAIIAGIAGGAGRFIGNRDEVGIEMYSWAQSWIEHFEDTELPYAFVSSAPRPFTEAWLARLGYEDLSLFLFGGDVAISKKLPYKPSPDVWIYTLKKMGLLKKKGLTVVVCEGNVHNLLGALKGLRDARIEAYGIAFVSGSLDVPSGNTEFLLKRRVLCALGDRKKRYGPLAELVLVVDPRNKGLDALVRESSVAI